MKRLFEQVAEWAMRHRSAMPAWMGRLMESAARNPDGLIGRLSALLLGGAADAPNTSVPDTELRVYVAPTNYSGQGYLWARALERSDARIGARNCAVQLPGGYAFRADTIVPIAVVNGSAEWAETEWQAARRFTHVIVEAERSMFGKQFGRDLAAEVAALETAGASVAFMCHGTDIRDPDRHAAWTKWSPYPEDPRTDVLREDARHNSRLLAELDRPVFVSTPDLLLDVPNATWCPVVVDAERFACDTPILAAGGAVRIIHASSNAVQKGSNYIEPALQPMLDAHRVEYALIESVPSAQMPQVFADADIVLDQFRLGSYGVAACEAMAAGRVVVGHVMPEVRDTVREATGMELPIVQATPDTIGHAVEELLADPQRMQRMALAGPQFVRRVHTGEMSARVLQQGWMAQ